MKTFEFFKLLDPCKKIQNDLKGLLRKIERGYRLKPEHFRSGSRPIWVLSDVPVSRNWTVSTLFQNWYFWDELLKYLDLSLYPFLFFVNSPFKNETTESTWLLVPDGIALDDSTVLLSALQRPLPPIPTESIRRSQRGNQIHILNYYTDTYSIILFYFLFYKVDKKKNYNIYTLRLITNRYELYIRMVNSPVTKI